MKKKAGIIIFLVALIPTVVFGATSARSGDWNNASTWGGSVPSINEDVVIRGGHNISIPSGGVTCGSLKTTTSNNSWAIISGRGQLTISKGGEISYTSFQNHGGVIVPMTNSGNISFDHCTFNDMKTLEIGSTQTAMSSNIIIKNSDFRNVFGGNSDKRIIEIKGRQGSHSGTLLLEHNTIVGKDGSEGIRLQNRDGALVKNNIFIDSQILQLAPGGISRSGGHTLQGNLFAHVREPDGYDSSRVIYVIPNEQPINIVENYIYDNGWNDHTITGGTDNGQTVIRKNVFEYSPRAKEANTISLAAVPLLVEENISIGYTSLISSVGNNSGTGETIVRNNITYNNGPVVPALFLSENGIPTYPMRFEHNTVVNGKYAFRHNNNPPKNISVAFSDNNIFWNINTPYHSNVSVSSGRRHDTTSINPNLKDTSRGMLSYYEHIEGRSADERVVAAKFATMNGYNLSTKQQHGVNSDYQAQSLRRWVFDGFNRGGSTPVCDTTHLNLCSTQTTCENNSGHWCKEICQRDTCFGGLDIRADVNQENGITVIDAMLVLKKTVGYSFAELKALGWYDTSITGDVNCSGGITSADALLILRYSVGTPIATAEWCVDK